MEEKIKAIIEELLSTGKPVDIDMLEKGMTLAWLECKKETLGLLEG